MLTLTIKDNLTEFPPGQVIEGMLAWRLDHPPKDAFLRLFWFTQGRGTQDVNVVSELVLPQEKDAHEQPFQCALPPYPYSFNGALISLQWAIELVLDKGREVQRLDILLSPWTEKLTLTSIEMK
jgi:hypothetical protein